MSITVNLNQITYFLEKNIADFMYSQWMLFHPVVCKLCITVFSLNITDFNVKI